MGLGTFVGCLTGFWRNCDTSRPAIGGAFYERTMRFPWLMIFGWTEMARVKSMTEIWPNGYVCSNKFKRLLRLPARKESLVAKHLCLTRGCDSSDNWFAPIGHLSSGPGNCITNASSHCYSRGMRTIGSLRLLVITSIEWFLWQFPPLWLIILVVFVSLS